MPQPPDNGSGDPAGKQNLEDAIQPSEEWRREGAWDTDPIAALEVENEQRLDEVQKAHQKTHVAVITHAGIIIVVAMYFFSALFIAALASWAFHHLAPASWHWMTADQLSKIQAIIFSGSLGAITTGIAQRYFKHEK